MIAGVWASLKGAPVADIPLPQLVLGGAVIGALAGCLVFLLDPADDDALNTPGPQRDKQKSGLIGRFLAVAGLALCWTPGLGLVLNSIGLWVNRNSTDWTKTTSKIGVFVGVAVATVLTALYYLQ